MSDPAISTGQAPSLQAPPSGTVTFLFTDIEGSTRRWEEYPQVMGAAVARHDALLRQTIEASGGYIFKTVGDAFCAAFPAARYAPTEAVAAHTPITGAEWGA